MGRQNYMTISVADTVQDMFNEFISKKGLTKTAALNDMVEMYMLAKDEPLYLELKNKYLNVESVKQMIQDRDDSCTENDFIFIKLGVSIASGKKMDGIQTMQAYVSDESKRGYTWFSTQSLYYGMSDKKVKYYNDLIRKGQKVIILFGIGEAAGGQNDISFSANVKKIVSDKYPISAPSDEYPSIYGNEKARIWIKLADIKKENKINASMLKVRSTGADLKSIISNSQYHFGYVCFK